MNREREQLLDQQYSLTTAPIDIWGTGLKHCIILGLNSDIAKGLRTRLERDGWTVNGTSRENHAVPQDRWDMLIVCIGTMEPIGPFFECDHTDWVHSLYVNATFPLFMLRKAWANRKHGARVVFMSGPNPTVPTPTYSAYQAGKAILQSIIQTLNAEEPSARFVWFRPGVVKTKIHAQTIRAGERAANFNRAYDILHGVEVAHSMDDVYIRLMNECGFRVFAENEGT